ncbi:Hypothetical predicted protein [Paramuricea clavata]|uniref:Uncharacterized protein n=1 Tax=Paramuricea clavata TaxID=317549 RepID=A0A7D9HY69_PARCT|nr:Hypothetical predicted protein [Paramuricea clavata]
MLLVVLVLGLIEIISGYNTTILQSSNSVNVSSVKRSSLANTYFSTITLSAVFSETTRGNNSVPSTRQLRPASSSFWMPHTTHATSESKTTLATVSETSRIVEETITTQFSSITSSHPKSFSLTPTSPPPVKTTKTLCPCLRGKSCEEKVFWWDVKPGTLKFMFYVAFGVALVSTVSLIVVCCRWRRQTKTVKKLQKQATTLSNPYVNNPVVGFPSPLRLSSFINRPESPYDTPEPVGTIQQEVEVSYVSVIDGNESESHYAAVTGNGTANCYADNESRDNDPLPSPAYTNASVFEMDPYEQLSANRTNENPYTSLITRDENEENQEDEVNKEDEENEVTI